MNTTALCVKMNGAMIQRSLAVLITARYALSVGNGEGMNMIDGAYGTCDYPDRSSNIPHTKSDNCRNWRPLVERVEIWRYTDNTLTVSRTDGACWNAPDTMFTNVRHEGVWDSKLMRFVSTCNHAGAPCDITYRDGVMYIEPCFSDGTPVASYEGHQPIVDSLDNAVEESW